MHPWILTSLADVDFYKLTMLQLYWWFHATTRGRYGFKNRSVRVPLGRRISLNELRGQLNHARDLRFTRQEIAFLKEESYRRGGLFKPEFLEFLRTLQLCPIRVSLSEDGEQLVIETETASLVTSMLWETLVMNVVSRLHFLEEMRERGTSEDDAWAEGDRRLTAKIAKLNAACDRGTTVPFIDFGTRRRWSLEWQEHVLRRLKAELRPGLLRGTSNVLLAMRLNEPVVGTMAHECDMAYQGIWHGADDHAGYLVSHDRMLDDWTALYGDKLSVALSDTYGSAYFFRTFGAARARQWKGLRQDSGDVYAWGERFIAFYEGLGIDPRTKSAVFSDSLDVGKMIALAVRFGERMQILFGWGTDLMNDMGFAPLSIVVKLIWCDGHWLVKVSDDDAKATGPADAVARVRELAGFNRKAFEEIPGATVEIHWQEAGSTCGLGGSHPWCATVRLPNGEEWDVRNTRPPPAGRVDDSRFLDGTPYVTCVDLPDFSGVEARRVVAGVSYADLPIVTAAELRQAFST